MVGVVTKQAIERFNEKVIKSVDGCWLWNAAKYKNHYGKFYYDGKLGYAHRFSYQHFNGEIPKGYFVCHKCDIPSCVNPEHLFLGTPKDNTQDMVSKERHEFGENRHNSILSEQDALEIIQSTEITSLLAEKYGVKPGVINGIRAGRKWKHLSHLAPKCEFRPKGEQSYKAKLTEQQAIEIKYGGKDASDLAKEFCIGKYLIYQIRSGKTWKHI